MTYVQVNVDLKGDSLVWFCRRCYEPYRCEPPGLVPPTCTCAEPELNRRAKRVTPAGLPERRMCPFCGREFIPRLGQVYCRPSHRDRMNRPVDTSRKNCTRRWGERGKFAYATEAEALTALAEARPKSYDPDRLGAYECAACGLWHLGRTRLPGRRTRWR